MEGILPSAKDKETYAVADHAFFRIYYYTSTCAHFVA